LICCASCIHRGAAITPVPNPFHTQVDAIGATGNRVQWIGCITFVIAAISIALHSLSVHKKSRIFHLIATLHCSILALEHYSMATGSGSMLITLSTSSEDGYDFIKKRQIFHARYIAWYFSSCLILLNPALLAGLAWVDIITMLVMVQMAITSSLMAALLSASWVMWGWYGFLVLFATFILYILIILGRRAAAKQPEHITSLYDFVLIVSVPVILVYVVFTGIGDGVGLISVNTNAILFTICDLIVCIFVPIFLIWVYQRNTEKYGHGPNAISDHFAEHRAHGWEGEVQLPRD